MTIGTSIVLIAVGLIMAYALDRSKIGPLEVQDAGIILAVLGVIGLILSLLYTFVGAGRRERVVEEEVPVRRRERL